MTETTRSKSTLVPDGKFRNVKGTGMEVALSRNGRQVCIRDSRSPERSMITTTEAWTDFLEDIKAGRVH